MVMLSAQFNSGYRHHLMRKALSGAFFSFPSILYEECGEPVLALHISLMRTRSETVVKTDPETEISKIMDAQQFSVILVS